MDPVPHLSPPLLSSLPPELMVNITNLLDARSVAYLYACGSDHLNCLLGQRGGLTSLTVRYKPPVKLLFPTIVRRFRTLQHLSVKCSAQFMIEGTDLRLLPPTMLTLDIRFWNSVLSFFDWNGPEPVIFDLKSMFPLLERIRTRETAALPPELYIPKLPTTLVHFVLDSDCPSHLIASLPRTLRKLRLTMSATDQDWSKDPLLPPNLTCLRLGRLSNLGVVQWLPTHLFSVELLVGHDAPFWDADMDEQAIWGQLPPMLVELEISVRILTIPMLKILPPLSTLRLRVGPKSRISYSHVAALPPSLTEFFCNNPSLLSSDLSMLKMMPRHLTRLPNFITDTELTQEELKVLPPGLTTLKLKKLVPGLLKLFPPALRELELFESGSECGKDDRFPPTVTHMKLEHVGESVLKAIQSSGLLRLHSLHICLSTVEDLNYLPDRIRKLVIGFPKLLAIATGTPFTRFYRLSHLSIQTGASMDGVAFQGLPTSLTYLNVGVRRLAPTLLSPVATHLPKLTHLLFGRLESPLYDHHLLFLPPLMETLAIYAASYQARSLLTPAGWSLLPQHLRSLSIPDPFEELEIPWDPTHLEYLIEFEYCPNSVDTFLRRKADEFKKLQRSLKGSNLLPTPEFVIDFEDNAMDL